MAIPSCAHLNVHFFIGVCRHQDLITAVPTMIWYVDFSVLNGVTGLFAWPTAKFPYPPALKPHGETLGVLGSSPLPIEGRGTDATFVVPHVPFKPCAVGPLFPLIVLLGSSKIIMGSNRTRIWCRGLALAGEAEQAVGCCVIPYFPISLNLQCWDIPSKKLDLVSAPMPTDLVVAPHSVQVGIEFSDYLAAMIDWAIDVAFAVLFAFGAKKGSNWWAKRKEKNLAKATAKAKKAHDLAKFVGMSDEAAERVEKRVFAEETKPFLPKWISNVYDRIDAKPGGTKWLAALAGKVPYKLLVKNTEWYREGVQRPIEKKLPRKLW